MLPIDDYHLNGNKSIIKLKKIVTIREEDGHTRPPRFGCRIQRDNDILLITQASKVYKHSILPLIFLILSSVVFLLTTLSAEYLTHLLPTFILS